MLKNVTALTPETAKHLVKHAGLLNKRVLITTDRNSKYIGKLVHLGKDKFTLIHVEGLSKAGTYKFMERTPAGKREFNYASTISIINAEVYIEPEYEILGRPVDRADVCKILE
jgi:hypothetical protein